MKTSEELQTLIDTYENGNKGDFRSELFTLNAYEVATLISMWQPYHSAIARIQISYDHYCDLGFHESKGTFCSKHGIVHNK